MSASPVPTHLPNSELEIMLIVWDANSPVTRPYIEKHLEGKKAWGSTTILKFLSRLVSKGFLSCEPMASGKMNLYTALISENDYLSFESNSVIGRLCGRSVTSLVANLYKNKSISDSDLEQLQKFLNEARRGKEL